MKVTLACVGHPRSPVAEVVTIYEARVAHYFRFEVLEVRETPNRGQSPERIIADEGDRLLARIPNHTELIALHRPGKMWSSEALAGHLDEAGIHSVPGVTFVIGGAFGLAPAVLTRADRSISLSAMTLPHEIARLLLAEQLYRAGTILRGEPYHKGKGT
jgi:23S rRNA (pseudouridine1915-N3)-methyltransferase